MFVKVSKTIAKFRYFLILFWIALAIGIVYTAPNLHEVIKSNQVGFIPDDSAPVVAGNLLKENFPESHKESSAVLVFHNKNGLKEKDYAVIEKLKENIWELKSEYPNISDITSSLDDTRLEKTLISRDKKAMLMVVHFDTIGYHPKTNETAEKIREMIKDLPKGLEAHLTGEVGFGLDQVEIARESVDKTTVVTIALVALILVFIYRSPIAPLLPLTTIGISFLVSRGVVAFLGQEGFKVTDFTETFLVAVLFGAGTDYCLLLISRFKEELVQGKSKEEALSLTLKHAGEAVLSSGGTVMIGFFIMGFAKFGLFSGTGPNVAIGVGITLIAVMTFTPALLYILGPKLFWPFSAEKHREKSRFWGFISTAVVNRPGQLLIAAIVFLSVFLINTPHIQRSFDNLIDLGDKADSVQGYNVMKEKFGEGEILPVTIVLTTSEDLWDGQSLQALNVLTIDLKKLDQVAKVRSATHPDGKPINELKFEQQLDYLVEGQDQIEDGFGPLYQGFDKLAKGTVELKSGLQRGAGELNKVANGVEKAGQNLTKMGQSITDLQKGITASQSGLSKSEEILMSTEQDLNTLAQNNSELLQNPNFLQAIGKVKGVQEGVKEVNIGLGGVNESLDLVKGGVDQIESGLSKASLGQREIAKGVDKGAMASGSINNGLRSLKEGLWQLEDGIGQVKDEIEELSTDNKTLAYEYLFRLPPNALNDYPELKEAMEGYISKDGKTAKLQLVLNTNPYSKEALDLTEVIEERAAFALKGSNLEGAKIYLGGATSNYTTLRDITNEDFIRVLTFVLLGIFIVLVFLLGSVISPLYMIVTILISYAATMGLTVFVFQNLLGLPGVSWSVPFFSFVILVALGIDYNIFLMSRVKEECKKADLKEGMRRAVHSTGGIITSCGVIMAGTFGAMMVSPMETLVQIGFATVVGLLLDTFLIRCILVPAIAIKLGKLNWWPDFYKGFSSNIHLTK